MAFDVNDAGRAALGGSIGPEIGQIEGRLLEKDSDSYLLAVLSTQLLRGGLQVWSGEQVRLRFEHLGAAYVHRYSLGRSIGLGLAGLGGFVAILAANPFGGGTTDNPQPCDTCSGNTRIGRP